MTNKMPILEIQDLTVSFTGDEDDMALRDISFSIEKGRSLALLGASGSGKSVTSLAVMGLLPENARSSGSIRLEGRELNGNTDWQEVRGKEIAMIFQEPMSALNPLMTCGEQLVEGIRAHQPGISHKTAKAQAVSWMEKVLLPDPLQLFHKYPHELSGGQKQRIMIAMALSNKPKLLIADEPTTALDVLVQLEILQLLKSLQQEYELALLFITHDLSVAEWIADEVCILEKGRVAGNRLSDYKKVFVLDEHVLPGAREDALLKVQNLDVTFGMQKNWLGTPRHIFKAVDNVSFSISKGNTLGIVGGSGSGKSTVSKCIMGIVPAAAGNIFFKGMDLTALSPKGWRSIRKEMQMIFQDPHASLSPRMNVGDMLAEVMQVHHIGKGGGQRQEYIRRLLDKVGLPVQSLKKYPHEFSGGQKQRLCIARALVVEPEFIICDESIAALDTKMQYQILNLLKAIQQEDHLTYLFITHDLKIAEIFCDEIVVMQEGRIVEAGNAAQVLQYPQHDYTRQLKKALL